MMVEIFQGKQCFECKICLLTNVASYCQIHSELRIQTHSQDCHTWNNLHKSAHVRIHFWEGKYWPCPKTDPALYFLRSNSTLQLGDSITRYSSSCSFYIQKGFNGYNPSGSNCNAGSNIVPGYKAPIFNYCHTSLSTHPHTSFYSKRV
jgi:hypothetical protein